MECKVNTEEAVDSLSHINDNTQTYKRSCTSTEEATVQDLHDCYFSVIIRDKYLS